MRLIGVVEEKNAVDKTRPSYTLVLTHDIDVLSVCELPISGRTLWGFVYRCLLVNLRRFIIRRLSLQEYMNSVKGVVLLPLVRRNLARDPWRQSLTVMLDVERRLGVRSTLFFIPFSRYSGHRNLGNPAPRHRAAHYELAQFQDLIRELDRDGWEVGLHGIDAHLDTYRAKEELNAIRVVVPHRQRIGVRMHWLYLTEEQSWKAFEDAGLAYDASLGWNDRVGFPRGQYQPFVPQGLQSLVVLPLVIQDNAVLGGRNQYAGREEAWHRVEQVLQLARRERAVVTILWHNNSFVAPRYWGWLYEALIQQARKDGARICRAIDAVELFSKGEL